MQTFTARVNKAMWPTYHVLKTITTLLPDSMGRITRATVIRHALA